MQDPIMLRWDPRTKGNFGNPRAIRSRLMPDYFLQTIHSILKVSGTTTQLLQVKRDGLVWIGLEHYSIRGLTRSGPTA